MSTQTPDLASQWKAFTPEQRDAALGRMTPEQKQSLATTLGYKGDAGTPPATTPEEPGLLEPHGGRTSVGDIFRGAASGIESLVDPRTYAGMAKNLSDFLPAYNVVGGVPIPVPNVEGQQRLMDQAKGMGRQAVEHPGYTAGQVLGPLAVGEGLKLGPKVVRSAAGTLAEKYSPRPVEVGGEKIPVLAGEANPESDAGRMQTRLKRSGSAQPKFEAAEKAQQEAVKQVIRRTAQQTSGLTGPISEEPGAAMHDAVTATFEKGRAMYEALDGQLKGYSAPLNTASKVVQSAIEKARKLGIDVDISANEVLFDGKKINPKDNPGLWQKLRQQGIVNEQGEGTPLAAYKSVYSQLLKMQRAATDEAARYRIGQEVKSMDAGMESALKGTPIYDNWKAADQTWAKAYALRDVADAIADSTKGTPAAKQAPGIAPVPTRLQASALVDRLNTLADDGILQKAFTPDEAANLRQSADILDRIQRTPVGKGFGESMSRSRGLTHAVSGAKGPVVGAALGGAAGILTGHPLVGAEAGAGIGFLVQAVGERALVNIMTKTDGVTALRALADAKTPEASRAALTTLGGFAAQNQKNKPVAAALQP
jgi:hypothetical protein